MKLRTGIIDQLSCSTLIDLKLRTVCFVLEILGIKAVDDYESSERGLLSVAFTRTTIMQSRACSVVAPAVWNSLPPAMRLLSRTLSDTFYNQLKTVLFDRAGVGSTSE